jgi:membrane-associated protease RseP (regulator of RpoE activity)
VSVEPGSAGAKAGIRKEHFITRVKLVLPSDEKSVEKGSFLGSVMQSFRGKSTDQEDNSNTYLIASEPNSGPDPTFPDLEKITVMQLQRLLDYRPIQELEFSIAIVENKLKVKPEPSGSLFLQDRGLLQYRQVKDLPPQPYGVCLSRAVKDIPDSIRQVIGTIRSLISQRVSKKLLGGPVTIATTAYATASEGLGTFLKFLGMLSINLAVMNFLPIPPLDGGQMCFLIGEKIKGSPLPERVQVGFTMLGLSAVLSLMVVVLYQDFMRIFGLL